MRPRRRVTAARDRRPRPTARTLSRQRARRSAPRSSRRRELQPVLAQRHRRRAAVLRPATTRAAARDRAARSGANRTYHYWHVFVPGVQARADLRLPRRTARSTRERGLRFDAAKVLLDPYGRGVVVPTSYSREAARRAGRQRRDGDEERGRRSRAPTTGKATRRCAGPSSRTIIYEMHVRGFTRHPSSGRRRRRRAAPTPA